MYLDNRKEKENRNDWSEKDKTTTKSNKQSTKT